MMIAIADGTMKAGGRGVPHTGRGLMRVMDALRDEAAVELDAVLQDVSGKKVSAANVPGAGRTFLSRCRNGDGGNPLYRLVALFVLARRLGIPKSRLQRVIDWLQEVLDRAYEDAPAEEAVKAALDRDAELDPRDEHLRYRASHGCRVAAAEYVRIRREQVAHAKVTIASVERWLATEGR